MQLNEVPSHYDRAARWYDVGCDLIFDRLLDIEKERRCTVALLGELSGARVLDLGVGTGANLPLLVPEVGASGQILGVDYSAGMLARAQALVTARSFDNVTLQRGDAVLLEGVEGPFDAVISVWCLGIVYDLRGALERALGLLRPGGKLAIMDFRRVRPATGPLNWLFPLYAPLLRASGIDSREDLDAQRYAQRWQQARAWLDPQLEIIAQESYFLDTGFILVGVKR